PREKEPARAAVSVQPKTSQPERPFSVRAFDRPTVRPLPPPLAVGMFIRSLLCTPPRMRMRYRFLAVVPALFVAHLAAAQQRAVPAADYEHAEQFLSFNTNPLVFGTSVRPTWLADDRFWFRDVTPNGAELILVDPAKGTRTNCDPNPAACGIPADALAQGGRGGFGGRGGRGGRGAANQRPPESLSPDGSKAAFIRDWNLWMRDIASGRETQLTTDGVKDFGYATDNAGWTNSDRAVLLWSPDSKKIATFQQDQRGDGDMYLVSTRVGHPELRAW